MGNLKPFRRDFFILFAAVAIIFLLFLVVDLPRGEPAWSHDLYYPDDDEGGTTGTGGEDTEGAGLQPVEESIMSVSGHTDEGQSSSESFSIDHSNTTQIRASLTWTDDLGNNDQFSLGLMYEGDNIETVSSTSGTLELVFNSPSIGEYQLVVTAVDCPGAGLGISPVDRDSGNDWQLSADMTVMLPGEGGA